MYLQKRFKENNNSQSLSKNKSSIHFKKCLDKNNQISYLDNFIYGVFFFLKKIKIDVIQMEYEYNR